MKRSAWIILAVLLPVLLSSCRTPKEKPPPPPPPSEMAVAKARLREVADLMRQEEYAKAKAALAPLVGAPYLQRDVDLLNRVIASNLEKPRVERAKRLSTERALGEIDRRLILPETYDRTRVIAPDSAPFVTGPFHLPPGPMEELINRKVDMNLEGADVRTMLMTLSEIDGLNLIADDALADAAASALTISVRDVPLKNILGYISRNMGIAFHVGDNVIWVTAAEDPGGAGGPELTTRIVRLKRGQIPGAAGAGAAGGEDDLMAALTEFVGSLSNRPEGALMQVYRNRNILILRDSRENIRYMESLIEAFDEAPLQVLIEARFMTISQADLFQVGSSIGQYSFTKDRHFDITGSAALPAIGQGVGGVPTLEITGILDAITYEAVLTAFSQTRTAKTLEAPRVTTINNHSARIRRGDQRYFFTDFEVDTTGGDDPSTTVVPSGEATELELGTTLEVNPTIGNDGKTIQLAVTAEINEFIELVALAEGVAMPRTNENSISTTVVINSGETVVLGGMLSSQDRTAVSRVPILGDLPIVGFLFRKKEVDQQPIHLLIFIKAIVMDPDGAFNLPAASAGAKRDNSAAK